MVGPAARASRHRAFGCFWLAVLFLTLSLRRTQSMHAMAACPPLPLHRTAEHLWRTRLQQALLHHLHQHCQLLALSPQPSLQAMVPQDQACGESLEVILSITLEQDGQVPHQGVARITHSITSAVCVPNTPPFSSYLLTKALTEAVVHPNLSLHWNRVQGPPPSSTQTTFH